MDLLNNIHAILVLEGIINVDNLDDFKKDQLNQAFKNMHTPITGIPAVAAAGGDTAVTEVDHIPSVLVYAKCDLRLKVAPIDYYYYISIVNSVTPANMNYTNVLKEFNIECEALITLS